MQPRLPPEIIDCIIDALADKPALLTCSSVARAWVARSRHRLFCSLHLRLTRPRVLRLKYLIESAHGSGFFAHVNRLDLVYADSAHLVELWQLLSHFTRLQSLSIVPARQTDAMRLADMHPLIQLPLLTDLRITKVRFRWYPDLAMVLTRVGACLRVLHLSGSVESVSKYRRKIKPPTITLPNLECLRIAPSGGLLGWLKWSGWALRAPRVELIFGKDDEEAILSLLWDYFDALGARLTYVVFSFDNERQLEDLFRGSSPFKNNRNLTCFSITPVLCMVSEKILYPNSQLPLLLRHLSSCGTRSMHLAFGVGRNSSSVRSPAVLRELAGAIDSMQIARVSLFGPWDRVEDVLAQQALRAFTEMLPGLDRGIVKTVPYGGKYNLKIG